MAGVAFDRLRKWLGAREWVKGAVNFDEDLHFSSYYLRASCAAVSKPLYPGYSSFIAFYHNFNETYYLLKSECRSTATALVRRALRQPAWLGGILRQIRKHADALAQVFPEDMTAAWLERRSHADLLALYRRHDAAHRTLYKYARLPEALDRGGNYFTDYLRNHLVRRGISASAAEQIFAAYAQPAVPSVLAQEIIEFNAIVDSVSADQKLLAQRAAGGRARMLVAPQLRRRLEAHRDKWRFLSYHGYGRRDLPTLDHYVDRLVTQVRQSARAGALDIPSSLEARCRFDSLLARKLDRGHRSLLDQYAEIGAAKLYRRHAQLRNFYYLDLLLAEIAGRIGVSEWTVRCMLPEEVVACLRARRLVDPTIRDREEDCLFARLGNREHVLAGKDAAELRQLLQAPAPPRRHGNVLRGTVACRGQAAGPCRVVIRANDCPDGLPKGTILVSEATDPDLVPYLRSAAAVLTEQGGVTSHAAIICRELGIPTIVGIAGLLESVHDGDWLDVDAKRGTVTVKRAPKSPTAAKLPKVESTPAVVGAKAHNLQTARSFGFAIPEFVLVDCEDARRVASQPASPTSRRLVQATLAALGLTNGAKLAIRSSAIDEDRAHGSRAGQYRSLLNVDRAQMAEALCRFVKSNHLGSNGSGYRGSIIVQRMIDADFAGVCLTRDPRANHANALILELKVGGNQAITGGTVRPDRLVLDRLTGDILEDERSSATSPAPSQITPLVQQFLELEARFAQPLDIEWAVAKDKLYILQVRPIA